MPKKTASTKKTTPPKTDYQAIAQNLLEQIGIDGTVSFVIADDYLNFQVETSDPTILIGFHGDTLMAFQRILGLILEKQTGSWQKLTVNVGDYKERHEESLRALALATAQRVKFSQQPLPLLHLSAADRRVVHMVLADHPDVTSESEGEGFARHLVIKPKAK